jgi:type II pantothenate kinase
VGLTGGGASRFAHRLGTPASPRDEFDAWRVGARALLVRDGRPAGDRDLLVSLGTGTSVLLAEPERATRVGGTALGGGTLLGLGALLTRASSFEELVELAARGDRRSVDLLVSDIYRDAAPPLPGDLNASSFAKLGRQPPDAARTLDPCDLAHALMGLVGENVALICAGLAALTGARRLVFGGSTLRGNESLREVLQGILGALGRDLVFLEDGEFAGALGALLLEDGSAA